MDVKVSRNALCPCGSGKKYKKCCGANEVISLTQVVETEIEELQRQLLHYALQNYGDEMEDNFEDFQQEFQMNHEAEIEFFEFVHTIWFTLFERLDESGTILDGFIASELRKIKRPKLKQILQSWKDARVIVGKIISVEGNTFIVEDLLSSDRLEAIMATKIDEPYQVGVSFSGILLPYDQKYVFFPAPFDLPDLAPESVTEFIKDTMLEADYDDPQEFLTDYFLEMMYELPTIDLNVEIDDMEWPDPIYQDVAELFRAEFERMGEDKELIDTGILLWNSFCQIKQKRIKNPNLYVAALHYFMSTIAPIKSAYTQKELAEQYGVSTGSLSSVYRELDIVLSEIVDQSNYDEDEPAIQFSTKGGPMATERAMQEVLEEIQGKNFKSIDEVNEFLNNKLSSPKQVSNKLQDQAQQLIYDAFEAEGSERFRLAEKALELNPNLVDAYNILAENADSLEEAVQMYEKGMWIGNKELGKNFFKENKGHFWGLLETRPFMRAKGNYAEALYQLGKIKEAIVQYEELLELNPNDNQGVRYFLFIAYVDKGDLTKAHKLLGQYEEGTAQALYNRLLLELLEHGYTAKAGKLLKNAKESNKFVIQYLTGKKRLPKVIPDYYGFGDENEAIIYAEAHMHLWKKIDGIKDWLK
ncbi:YecA family protein [Bacillus sp. EB600]|uniref:YecA family protein n=1 Tax=Bacillus sp. EB600 TaxID=2806345 RepID=UPI00210956D8|nr:SEC-C metal-binding domain-containing protein [Bacillus sp. EB600]MCQ6278711.1 SEC-C domain-containing protein [Bacillus sp. EB600]